MEMELILELDRMAQVGGVTPGVTGAELREDGGYELREDGGYELRE